MLKVGLLCGVIAAMSATGVSSLLHKPNESKDCDSRFIIELKEDIHDLTSNEAIEKQNKVFKKIQGKVNSKASVVQHFSVLNNAFTVSANEEDLEAISSLPGVKNVYKEEQHIIEQKANDKGITLKVNKAGASIDVNQNASAVTMQKSDDTNDGEGTLIAILDNEFYFKGRTPKDAGFHHEVFDKLPSDVKTKLSFDSIKALDDIKEMHAKRDKNVLQGYEGSLYFNNKVPFYYDYAGDSETGSSHELPMDYDVHSEIGLHGSHVASIAAANATKDGTEDDKYTNYKGIAPKAQLACMKVFSDVKQTAVGSAADMGNYSTFTESGFLSALEDSILIGADVINVSIGSDLDDFDLTSITMRTLERLTDEGVLSAISAGNGGKSSYSFAGGYGNWTRDMVETGILGSFANNSKTMSIASGQPDWVFYENAFKMGEENVAFEDQIVNREGFEKEYDVEYKMSDLMPDAEGKFSWVYVPGFGTVSDFNAVDCEGKIAVVNRGSIDFSTKYQNAKDSGARALVIINNDPTAMDFTFRCSFGDDFKPSMPACLVLFKDKPLFQNGGSGKFSLITKEVADNKAKRTISDFSSDGARFDLDLKPEITTPGTNIRGAVYPQNKEEKETPYSAYEYFNGTSMAAPNYAGAVGVLVSKYAKAAVADGTISKAEEAELVKFRKTVNMRFMSTAVPMSDFEANGEDGKKSISSPRIQGAGMVNLNGAYHTDVYLKGSDGNKVLDKSKILLRNNPDIAKGDLKLSFTAVNESAENRDYDVKVTVMRPATILSNKVVSKEYNLIGEVGDLNLISGLTYAVLRSGEYVMETNPSTAKPKDVINISRDLEYYLTPEDAENKTNAKKFEMGYYYFTENNTWEKLPDDLYQSVKDKVIAEITGQSVSIAPGESKVTINPYSLTEEAKDEIARLYPYGTYIEGYVTLTAKQSGVPNLSIPYLGFYSLTDKEASNSFATAPVVEPFSFEKDKKTIYASDLVNDVTKQLLGKDNVNFESMWLSGYAESTSDIDVDEILSNDSNFMKLKGFASVATTPDVYGSTEFTENPTNDIYVGNPQVTNTMVIQQFVMRSVKDNFFEIKNKATGEVVYKSALEDMLFGEQGYKYPLYKSHVDSDYLGAGYVAHRAYAIVPLYNPYTKEAFASGDYDITFNYNLASTDSWVTKTYVMHVDAEAPVVSSICDFKEGEVDKVRITFKDTRVAYAIVGSTKHAVSYDENEKEYYVDLTKDEVDAAIREAGKTSFSEKRLYVAAVDYARGKMGALIHFDSNEDYSHFTIVQGYGLEITNDFKFNEDGSLKLIKINEYHDELDFSLEAGGVIAKGYAVYSETGGDTNTGLIIGLSCGGGALLLGGIAAMLIIFKKKKMFIFGGK